MRRLECRLNGFSVACRLLVITEPSPKAHQDQLNLREVAALRAALPSSKRGSKLEWLKACHDQLHGSQCAVVGCRVANGHYDRQTIQTQWNHCMRSAQSTLSVRGASSHGVRESTIINFDFVSGMIHLASMTSANGPSPTCLQAAPSCTPLPYASPLTAPPMSTPHSFPSPLPAPPAASQPHKVHLRLRSLPTCSLPYPPDERVTLDEMVSAGESSGPRRVRAAKSALARAQQKNYPGDYLGYGSPPNYPGDYRVVLPAEG